MCSTIIDERKNFLVFFLHFFIQTFKHIAKSTSGHPSLMVGRVICWQIIDIFKTSRFLIFSDYEWFKFVGPSTICFQQYC